VDKLTQKARELFGIEEGTDHAPHVRAQAGVDELCGCPGFEDVTSIPEQLALGALLPSLIDDVAAMAVNRMAEADGMARNAPATAIFGLVATRLIIAQLQVLEEAMMQSAAISMADYVSTLPEAEGKAMMEASRKRVEDMIAAMGGGGSTLGDLLRRALRK
jgi:hypothetical protein